MSWHPDLIGAAVREELGRFGAAGALGEILAAWEGAVGSAIAGNAWPARCGRDGVLHVATSSSVWAFELTRLESTIRERLARQLGAKAPARLRFAVGPLPERGFEDVTSRGRAVAKVRADELAAGEEIAASIENEGLRTRVARAAAASLARARETAPDRPLW